VAKNRLSSIDNRDDRATIWKAIHSLTPLKRVELLAMICQSAADGFRNPRPKAHMWDDAKAAVSWWSSNRLTTQVFNDLWLLVADYGLDAMHVATTVVSCARRPDRIPPAARPAAPVSAPRSSALLL
jgi:hypothetical protein